MQEMKQERNVNRKEKIIELARKMGIIRPRDVEAAGVPSEYLLRLYRQNEIERRPEPLRTKRCPDQRICDVFARGKTSSQCGCMPDFSSPVPQPDDSDSP